MKTLSEEFLEIFSQVREDGSYLYEDEVVRDALVPLSLAWLKASGEDELPTELRTVVEGFLKGLGLSLSASGEEIQAAMDSYYEQNPLPSELTKQINDFIEKYSSPEAPASS